MSGNRDRPAGRLREWLGGIAGVAGALVAGRTGPAGSRRSGGRPSPLAGSRLRGRSLLPEPARRAGRLLLHPGNGMPLVVAALAVLSIARLPVAVLGWLALAGSVQVPLFRRRGAMVPLSSAALSWMLIAWTAQRIRARDFTVAESRLNRPLLALAVTTAASGLRGILARDREVPGLHRFLAAQIYATGLPLLSVGAAFLVGNQLATREGLRWLRRAVLGAGALQLARELRVLPRSWPFPPWGDLVLGHATSLGVATVLYGPGGALTRAAGAGVVACAWTRTVLLNLIRPNERQWISGWTSMTLPAVTLLTAKYPKGVGLALLAASPVLLRGSAGLWRVRAIARAKGDFDRLVIWRDALRLAMRRPALGAGPGNYPDHARRYYVAYATAPAPMRAWAAGIGSAHGNYPQLAVDTGLAGLGAAAWVLARSLSTARSLFRTVEDPLLRSLVAGIGASLVGQTTAGVLSDCILPSYHNEGYANISSTVYTWALIGALVAIEAGQPPGSRDGIPGAAEGVARRTSVPALGGFLLAAATGSALLGTVETLREGRAARRVTRRDRERDLEGRLESRMRRFRGDVGIYAKDVTSGVTYEYRAGELFPISSVFKLFVLVHAFRRHEAGGLSLTERRPVPDSGISRLGPGVLKYLRGQPRLSVRDYCRLMIVWSDNVATDVLMQSETPSMVNETLAALGLATSRVSGTCTEMTYRMAGCDSATVSPESEREIARRLARGELRNLGFADRSPRGTVGTPREMGGLLEQLLRGKAVGADATDRILGLLEDTAATSRSVIPRFLPGGVAIAHRAGGTWRALADAGIVDVRGRPIVLAVCAHHDPAETGAADLLADVSRMLFEWFRAPAHLAARA